MKRKSQTPEQVVKKLPEADAATASGSTVEQVCRQLQISDATYYNWRKQSGQMRLRKCLFSIRSVRQKDNCLTLTTCLAIVEPKDEGLKAAASIIENNIRDKLPTYVNVNNHYEGCAPLTIQKLLRLL